MSAPDELAIVALDLRETSHVFDHPVPATDAATPWYFQASYELVTEPRVQLAFVRQLFERPEATTTLYADAQINTGLWYMFLAAADEHFLKPLWDIRLPWPDRAACWAALPDLYERYLARRDLDIAFMLPDFLADGRLDHLHAGALVSGHEQTAEAMMLALRMLLEQPDHISRMAALHGLHHLRAYPGAMTAVETFLATQASSSGKVAQYARDVLLGNVM
jgi:cytochrome P450